MSANNRLFHQICPSTEERALVSGLFRWPTNRPRLGIYADWLEDSGQSDKAQFMRLRMELLQQGESPTLLAERENLRSRIPVSWLSLMGDTTSWFDGLRARLVARLPPDEQANALRVTNHRGELSVVAFAEPGWPEVAELHELLRRVASVLGSYSLGYPLSWYTGLSSRVYQDLSWTYRGQIEFPNLLFLGNPFAWRTKLDGNRDNGAAARLLLACPNLLELNVWAAPDPSLFGLSSHSLHYLGVWTTESHEEFLLHLSRSRCFPWLRQLTYVDCHALQWPDRATPFSHYECLFRSRVMKRLDRVYLKAVLTEAETARLREIRSEGVHFGTLDD